MMSCAQSIIKYIIIFIVFSALGFIYEHYLLGKEDVTCPLDGVFNTRIPLCPLYGACGVILFFIEANFNAPIAVKILLTSVLANIVECIVGLISLKMYKYHKWEYTGWMMPFCCGYASVATFIFWTFLIAIMYFIIHEWRNKYRSFD